MVFRAPRGLIGLRHTDAHGRGLELLHPLKVCYTCRDLMAERMKTSKDTVRALAARFYKLRNF
jgi:hypothetical protein